MAPSEFERSQDIEVVPVVVLSRTFPARPSSIPDIRDFVRLCLSRSPLSDQDNRAVFDTVSQALLEAAGPAGSIQVCFRIFPDHVEVDVLRSHPRLDGDEDPELWPSTAVREALNPDRTPAWATPSPNERPQPTFVTPADPADETSGEVGEDRPFAEWMAEVLRREGLTMEAAAKQLGVSVKTVSRWVGGATEPRLRDLRRIHEVFGEHPLG